MKRHTISVLVENKFGTLARIAGLFSGRGYNIHTLNVAPSHDPSMSRMTIVVREKDQVLDQIIKELDRLINVVDVIDFREGENVYRELVLLRVKVDSQSRSDIIDICQLFRAKVVDVAIDVLTIEITGNERKIDRFLSLMEDFDVDDLSRTGKIALPRTCE